MEAEVKVNVSGAPNMQNTLDDASRATKESIDKAALSAKNAVDDVSDAAEQGRPMISNAVGKLALASVGAVGLTSDAVQNLLHRMVERGEMSKDDARRAMNKLDSKRPHLKIRAKSGGVAEASADMDDASTKADVQALQAQIAALSAKLDMLNADKTEFKPTLPKTTIK